MKAAIVLVDLLEDFFRYGRVFDNRINFAKNVNTLIKHARKHKIPVIWIKQEFSPDLSDAFLAMRKNNLAVTIKNTKGSKILKELTLEPEDYIVIKKRFSGFFNTDLEGILEKLSIDTLIIGGVNTHACVQMTVIDAYQRDYEVIIDTDCVDSFDEFFHKESLRYLKRSIATLKTNTEILEVINGAEKLPQKEE